MTSSLENKTADRKKLASQVAAFRKQTETAKKAAKSAKASVKQAKQEYKEARRAARKLRKTTKALEIQLAALVAKDRPRKSPGRPAGRKRAKISAPPSLASEPTNASGVQEIDLIA